MKIAIIGAGSSYTPELIEGILIRRRNLPVTEIVLVDIESGAEKLKIITELSSRMIVQAGYNNESITVSATFDREEALKNCSFVITQIRVGGLAARILDEEIPLKYGLLGQETTGAGGFAKALRTIPVILEIAHDMERLCPDAWLINFANPSGMVTEAVLKYTSIKCIGLCNVPLNMYRSLLKSMDFSDDIKVNYIGINHLSWVNRIWRNGADCTEELFTDPKFLQYAADILGPQKVNLDIVRTTKLIPSYYLKYFYHTDEQIKSDQEAVKSGKGTRGSQVQAVEKELFDVYASLETVKKPEQLTQRGGAYYSESAISLIQSLYNDDGQIHVVSVINNGAIADLPKDSIVETNCVIDRRGAMPMASGFLPESVASLVKTIKVYEKYTIEAALNGDYDMAIKAMLIHPLIGKADIIIDILNDILSAHKVWLPNFKQK